MDRYVSRDLQTMLCKELAEVAKKKEIDTPATLDVLKSLTSSLKNLMKIDKLETEMEMEPMGEMGGYSQRSRGRYYVDGMYGADGEPWGMYGTYGNSYAQGGRGMNNGQGGRGTYGYDSGNSYRYPRMYPIYTDDGYSRHGDDKEEVKKELRKMMENTSDEQMRKSISEILTKM